ncbi:response regulator transcription factor [Aggregatilineales bacterium SYSU G02658]
MIVEDHPLFRDGLCNALQGHEDIEIVGTCEDGIKAVIMAQQLQPDIMLVDVNLPGQNGILAMRHLRREMHKAPAVIILTAHHDDEQLLQVFGSGAIGFTDKTVHPDMLVHFVRGAARGYHVVEGQLMSPDEFATWFQNRLTRLHGQATTNDIGPVLTYREMEILRYLVDGMLNKEIAHELGLSEQTVKNHVTSILRKLNVKDRTQAAVTAIRRGWVRFRNN